MRGAHRRHQVDVKPRGPARLVVLHAEAGRVVDQDVDAAECCCRSADITRHRRPVAKIARLAVHFGPEFREAGLGPLQAFSTAGADGHVGAIAGKCGRDREADAPAAAADDGAFTLERELHDVSFSERSCVGRGGRFRCPIAADHGTGGAV